MSEAKGLLSLDETIRLCRDLGIPRSVAEEWHRASSAGITELLIAELNAAEREYTKKIHQPAERARMERKTQDVLAGRAKASRQVTIRISNADIALIKQQAREKGLKYQTYLKMVLYEELMRAAGAGAA